MSEIYLIGDIGGTHSNLALAQISQKNFKIIDKKSYATTSYKNIGELINNFLHNKTKVNKIILAVAGPVHNGMIKLTNGTHHVSKAEIATKTKVEDIELINDFTAVAYGIPSLKKENIKVINEGEYRPEDTISVIGAGTGLGKAILFYDKKSNSFSVQCSEGGHANFPAESDLEFEMIEFIKRKEGLKFVRWEDILSGRGLECIYAFLQKKPEYNKYFQNLSAETISVTRRTNKCAERTFDLFYKFYARAARDFALETLSKGGVYLAGGIVGKNSNFKKNIFMREFTRHDKFSEMLKEIPVYVIKDYEVSLYGLCNYILEMNRR